MQKTGVEAVLRGLERAGVSVATYLPDSLLKELYPALDAAPDIRTIPVTNARLGLGSGIPVVMIMSYRGEMGENNWWAIPHGITMEPLLGALRIPYRVVRREDEIEQAIVDAFEWSYTAYYHSAVVLGGEVVR